MPWLALTWAHPCCGFGQEYLGKVTELKMNDKYAAILSEDQITLHAIDQPRNSNSQRKCFPGT